MKRILACVIVAAVAAAVVPTAASQSPTTVTCRYELGSGPHASLADPTDATDGVHSGGCSFVFPDSGGQAGPLESPIVVEGEHDRFTLRVLDDLWGANGGGYAVCQDGDGDGICGEDGELSRTTCTGATSATSTTDWDGDGDPDLGHRLFVDLHGPLAQQTNCPNTGLAPWTTGGVTTEDGGIHLELG